MFIHFWDTLWCAPSVRPVKTLLFDKILINTKREKLLQIIPFSVSSIGVVCLGRGVSDTTLFISLAIKCYGDVATLTLQFASRCGFPSFCSLSISSCLLHYRFPILWKTPPPAVTSKWQHRRKVVMLIM
jgi:hypothetical protein